MKTDRKQTYLFTTWINCKANDTKVYKGSDGNYYIQMRGVPVSDIDNNYAMSLAWLHINNTTGWPLIREAGKIPQVAISKADQDERCKLLLQLN